MLRLSALAGGLFLLAVMVCVAHGARPGEQVIPWSAAVDPMAATESLDGAKVRLTLPVGFPATVLFAWPQQLHTQLAVGVDNGEKAMKWQVVELRTGKTQAAGQTDRLTSAIGSSDGKFIAGTDNFVCQVWSLSTHQKTVSLDSKTGSHAVVGFLGDTDQVAIATTNTRKGAVQVFDPASGKLVRDIAVPVAIAEQCTAISPGGRYLAIVASMGTGQGLYMLDLKEGKLVGTVSMPENAYHSTYIGSPAGLGFSPDGKCLGIEVTTGPTTRLIVLDMATGKTLADQGSLNLQASPFETLQGPAIQFMTDSNHIRLGHAIYDWHTGESVQPIPMPPHVENLSLLQMLSDRKAIYATAASVIDKQVTIATERVGD
jgi:sugar lactone lactonase YvrE